MATEEDVLMILRYMAAAWPRAELSEETVAVYVMHVRRARLSAEVLLLAAMALVDRQSFFPVVAEWLAEAKSVQAQRAVWYMTANYELGEGMPAGLSLPAELSLPPELAGLLAGGKVGRS